MEEPQEIVAIKFKLNERDSAVTDAFFLRNIESRHDKIRSKNLWLIGQYIKDEEKFVESLLK